MKKNYNTQKKKLISECNKMEMHMIYFNLCKKMFLIYVSYKYHIGKTLIEIYK